MSTPTAAPNTASPTEAVDLPVGLRTPEYTIGGTTIPRHGLLQWYAFAVFMLIFTVIGIFLFAYRYVRQKKLLADQKSLVAGSGSAKVAPAPSVVDGVELTEAKADASSGGGGAGAVKEE